MASEQSKTATAGWYDDGSGRQRFWDGTAWTSAFADAAPGHAPGPTDADRTRILNQAASSYLSDRWTISLSTPDQVVMQRRTRMGWFWNTVLVILTGGLWLIYVIYRALNRKTQTMTLTVDDAGRVRKQ